jgi:xylan 1,4-beta-xylosidase
MLGMMRGSRLTVESDHNLSASEIIKSGVRQEPDINAIASKSDQSIDIMVWNYHDDDITARPAIVELSIKGLVGDKIKFTHFRIDQSHSNSFEKWKSMGRPQKVNDQQYKILEKSGKLEMLESVGKEKQMIVTDRSLKINIDLPRQAVSLIHIAL